MIILTIRTDQPEAEIALFNDDKLLVAETWTAHRQLAETIHLKIAQLLKSQKMVWSNLGGVVCFKGPGSFTGLRIGLSVANATAYGLAIPVVSTQGENWQQAGIRRLLAGDDEVSSLPEYGAEAHITQPRK